MGTLTFQVAETAQTTLTKAYTLPDAHIDRLVAAYQAAANVSISGTATRAQVLLYWTQVMISNTTQQVLSAETSVVMAAIVVPTPIAPV